MANFKLWVRKSPKVLIVLLNIICFLLGLMFLYFGTEKVGIYLASIMVLPLILILGFSLAGFYIKNSFGWLFTVTPGFLLGPGYLFYLAPYNHFALKDTIVFLICFNLMVFFFNAKPYQDHFKIGGVKLLGLNYLAVTLSFFMVGIFISYFKYFI